MATGMSTSHHKGRQQQHAQVQEAQARVQQKANHILRLLAAAAASGGKEKDNEGGGRLEEGLPSSSPLSPSPSKSSLTPSSPSPSPSPSFDLSCLLLEYHKFLLLVGGNSRQSTQTQSYSNNKTCSSTSRSRSKTNTDVVSPLKEEGPTSSSFTFSPSRTGRSGGGRNRRSVGATTTTITTPKAAAAGGGGGGGGGGTGTSSLSKLIKSLRQQKRVLEDSLKFLPSSKEEIPQPQNDQVGANNNNVSSKSIVPFQILPPSPSPSPSSPSAAEFPNNKNSSSTVTTEDTGSFSVGGRTESHHLTFTVTLNEIITRTCFEVVTKHRLLKVNQELRLLMIAQQEEDEEEEEEKSKQKARNGRSSSSRNHVVRSPGGGVGIPSTMIEERRLELHEKQRQREQEQEVSGQKQNNVDGSNNGNNKGNKLEGMTIEVDVEQQQQEQSHKDTEQEINTKIHEIFDMITTEIVEEQAAKQPRTKDSNPTVDVDVLLLARALQLVYWLRDEFQEVMLGHDGVVKLATKIIERGICHEQELLIGKKEDEEKKVKSSSAEKEPLQQASLHLDGVSGGDGGGDRKDVVEGDNIEGDDGTASKEVDGKKTKNNILLVWGSSSESSSSSSSDDGKQRYWLGASCGMIGILHTLLGLSPEDWNVVQNTFPQAKSWIKYTIDTFFVSPPSSSSAGDAGDDGPTHFQQTRTWYPSGNIRPYLDACEEKDSTSSVDWFYGSTGLVMMLLVAARVFKNKDYAIHAHVILDQGVIQPRCRRILQQQQQKQHQDSATTGGKAAVVENGIDDEDEFMKLEEQNLPGLATIALCCLQLSQYSSSGSATSSTISTARTVNSSRYSRGGRTSTGGRTATSNGGRSYYSDSRIGRGNRHRNQDLKQIWRDRAIKLTQYTYDQWMTGIENDDDCQIQQDGSANPFGLYDGIGNLAVVMWHLSSQSSSLATKLPLLRLPLFSNGYFDNKSIPQPLLLSSSDVTVATSTIQQQTTVAESPKINVPPSIKRTAMKPTKLFNDSPPKSATKQRLVPSSAPTAKPRLVVSSPTTKQRPSSSPTKKSPALLKKQDVLKRQQQEAEQKRLEVEKRLAESKRRRLAAEEEARKRREKEALEEKQKIEKARQRRVEAETRRKAELARRKSSVITNQQRTERRAVLVQKRKEQEAARRKEQEEKRRQAMMKARKQAQERVQAQRSALNQHESKRLQDEAQKRKAEVEKRKKIAEAEKRRREAILKARLQREAEEAKKARQQEAEEKLKMEQHERRRQEELKRKVMEQKRRDAERRRRHEQILQRKKDLEEIERAKKAEEANRREGEAEKRRKEAMSLQKALLARQESEEQRRREEVLARKKHEEEKRQKQAEQELKDEEAKESNRLLAIESAKKKNSVSTVVAKAAPIASTAAKSQGSVASDRSSNKNASNRQRKQLYQPKKVPHYAAPTKSSNFWSLQTDPTIGSSADYKPNLVVSAKKGASTRKVPEKSIPSSSESNGGADGGDGTLKIQSSPMVASPSNGQREASDSQITDTAASGDGNDAGCDEHDQERIIDHSVGETTTTAWTSEQDQHNDEEDVTPTSRKSMKSKARAEKWQSTPKGKVYHGKKDSLSSESSTSAKQEDVVVDGDKEPSDAKSS